MHLFKEKFNKYTYGTAKIHTMAALCPYLYICVHSVVSNSWMKEKDFRSSVYPPEAV